MQPFFETLMTKVTIGIPTFNMAEYVGLAVESALAQTHQDIEIVVCDNASTDQTLEVLAAFKDPRLKIFQNSSNLGMIANFNRVIECATAPWIKFLEADDLLEPECVERMVEVAERHPNLGIVSVGRTLIDSDGRTIGGHRKETSEVVSGRTVLNRVRRMGNEIGTPTDVLIRRSVLEKVGYFDLEYGRYLNDWDLWLRIAEVSDVAFVAEHLTRVRRHEGQIGSIGQKTNIHIDVNHLFIKKRWADTRLFSSRWWQKMSMTMHFTEDHIWQGLSRLFYKHPLGVSRLDVFVRLAKNLGYTKYILGILYFLFRSPVRVGSKIMSR